MPRFDKSLYSVAAIPIAAAFVLFVFTFVASAYSEEYGKTYMVVAHAVVEHSPYGPFIDRLSAHWFGFFWLPYLGLILTAATAISILFVHGAYNASLAVAWIFRRR